jgi:nucleotide-binding universal stress UspA family protein
MAKISRILMPVDFSDRCLGMTHYARAIAEEYDAEIILLHVVNPVFITPDIGMAPPAIVAVPQWLITEKSKLLDEFATSELAGLRVRRLVYEGIPEMQIAEMAKSEDASLLIMPTHGYGVFRRFLIGSVTAKVLDDVKCPVLTGVHMEKHVLDGKAEFSTVACAVDLKRRSAETLLQAAHLAQDFGAKLAVVHMRPLQGQGGAANTADLQPQLEELVAGELSKANVSFEPGRLSSCVKSGDIDKSVCGFAESMGANLLVIGRDHGDEDGGKTGGRLRTHTYSIIRQASCPVLSI